MGRIEPVGANGRATDAVLVARARAGEDDAFEQLVRRHAALAVRAAYAVTRDAGLAEDAAQEAFWKVFRALPHYEDRGSFEAWLSRIARRCALDLIRRRRPEEPITELSGGGAPAREERRHEARELLEQALARLSPVDRGIVLALKADGRSVREVAAAFAMSATAVRVRAHRARRRLRKLIEEDLA